MTNLDPLFIGGTAVEFSVGDHDAELGLPDGMAIDKLGNLWATGPGGVLILSPAGKLLGRLNTGQATANCAFGDDGKTLFITADMFLCRVRTNVTGLPK